MKTQRNNRKPGSESSYAMSVETKTKGVIDMAKDEGQAGFEFWGIRNP